MGIFCRHRYKMAKRYKWEMIMDLEVQDMKGLIMFSSKDLVWSEIHRENMSIDCVALVPSHRVVDFIKGEKGNPAPPCTFVRNIIRNQQKGPVLLCNMNCKNFKSALCICWHWNCIFHSYVLTSPIFWCSYHCSFGP